MQKDLLEQLAAAGISAEGQNVSRLAKLFFHLSDSHMLRSKELDTCHPW